MSNQTVLDALQGAVRSAEGWWRADCPFCIGIIGTADTDKALGVHCEGAYHCFRCQYRGHLGYEVPDWLVSRAIRVKRSTEELEKLEGFTSIAGSGGAGAASRVRNYLRARGVGPPTWDAAGIGIATEGRFRDRIIVPVTYPDRVDRWAGYVGRVWYPTRGLRYLYPTGMDRSVLWEQWRLMVETDEPIILVEGLFDALPYYGHTVASLGKPTKAHIQALKAAKRPVVVCLDGDAWRQAYSLARRLCLAGVDATSLRLPAGQDPGSLVIRHGVDWLLDHAERSFGQVRHDIVVV